VALVECAGDEVVTRVPYLVRDAEESVLLCWRCMRSLTLPARLGQPCDHLLAAAAALPLTMVDDQEQPLAAPSALDRDGASFSVSDQQQSIDTGTPVSPWWWSN
jgi:hypothetical protein